MLCKKMSSFVRGSHLPESRPSVQVYYSCSCLSGALSPSTATTMPGRFLISSGAAAPNQTDKREEALPSLFTAGMVFVFFSLSPLLPHVFFTSLHRGSVPEKLWRSSNKSAILSEPSHPLPIILSLRTSRPPNPFAPKSPQSNPFQFSQNLKHVSLRVNLVLPHSLVLFLSIPGTQNSVNILCTPFTHQPFHVLLVTKARHKGQRGSASGSVLGILSSLFGARPALFIVCQDSVPPLVVKRGQIGANCTYRQLGAAVGAQKALYLTNTHPL